MRENVKIELNLHSEGYWEDEKHRKLMFCEVAHQQGFDPLVPAKWYSVSYSSLRSVKVSLGREGYEIMNNTGRKFHFGTLLWWKFVQGITAIVS